MNNKITFPRLATLLADRSGRSKRFSEDFLREFFSLVSESLEAGESVKIKGFGTFRLSYVELRRSVDVTTGLPMEISGHSKVVFVPAKELAEAINAPFEAFTAYEISDGIDISHIFTKDEMEMQDRPYDGILDTDADTDTEAEVDFEAEAPQPLPSPAPAPAPERHETPESYGPTLDIAPGASNESAEEKGAEPVISFMDTGMRMDSGEHKEPTPMSDQTDLVDEEEEEEEDTSALLKPEVSEAPSPESFEASRHTRIETAASAMAQEEPKAKPETAKEARPDMTTEAKPEQATETEPGKATAAKSEAATTTEPATETAKTTATETVNEAEPEIETEERRGKGGRRILLISLAAVVAALFATLAVWYVFATDDFHRMFRIPTSHATIAAGPSAAASTASDTVADTAVAGLPEEAPTAPSDPVVYDTISTTRYLTTMAKTHYGNYNLWPYIYEENKAMLGHPDRIRPGTAVVIPKLSKYGVDASKKEDIEKAKQLGVEIYSRYGKKI